MARPKDYDVEMAVETFARAIIEGHKARDAYRISHPNWKSTNTRASDVRACEFKKRPDVQEKIRELLDEMRERHKAFGDQLMEMLQQEIKACWEDNHTLSPVMKQVEVSGRFMGMDKQTLEVKGEVKAVDPDQVADKINFLVEQAKKGAK